MTRALKKIGVIGAGTMGNGIAQVSAAAGIEVVMIDVSDAAVERGIAAVKALHRPIEQLQDPGGIGGASRGA